MYNGSDINGRFAGLEVEGSENNSEVQSNQQPRESSMATKPMRNCGNMEKTKGKNTKNEEQALKPMQITGKWKENR